VESLESIPQGLKPGIDLMALTARLKSCPDTSCSTLGVFPQPVEPTAPAVFETPADPEPEAAIEPVPEPEAGPELAVAPALEPPSAELVAKLEPEAQPEPVIEAAAETIVEPESEPEPEALEDTVLEPLAATDPIVKETLEPEPASEPEPSPELVDEAAAEPIQVAEPIPEAVPESGSGTVPDTEPPTAPSAQPVSDASPASDAAPQAPQIPPQPTAEEKADERAAAKLVARQKMLDESSEQSPFSVIVGQVYDGPLDLLLDLIRKQDIDIYDIPIAKITAQFLAYVNQLKATDVDVAGEFIYTASLLIHIKSKMLLPRAPAGPDDTPEDPRRELVERLLEHERFKNAAQMLQQKQMLEAATWTNPGAREFKDDEGAEPEIAADTVDLVRIFRDILERARKRPVIDLTEDSVTVGQMIQYLSRRLTMEDKPVALRRLLSHTRSERALIAMFLALLELVRMQAILLRQDKAFSEIFIKKHTGFDTVMNEGLGSAHDDWR
jgi:segregation and condensation protein A